MTRRRLLFGFVFASAALVCFACLLWLATPRRPTLARFEQVTKGMSRDEVMRTVGGPPTKIPGVSEQLFIEPDVSLDVWACEDGMLLVHFDDDGTAARVSVAPLQPPTFIDRIRRWLGM
jgi:hypothetical protein